MESLEYVRAYLDDLLCISKSSLEDHLEKLEEIPRQHCNAGLKVNSAKSAPSNFLGESIPTSEYQFVLRVLQTFSKEKC